MEKLVSKIVEAILLQKFGREKYDFFINSDSPIVKTALETMRYNIGVLLVYTMIFLVVVLISSIILIIRYA